MRIAHQTLAFATLVGSPREVQGRLENSFLGRLRPQDVLAVEPAQVVAAARGEIKDVAHA